MRLLPVSLIWRGFHCSVIATPPQVTPVTGLRWFVMTWTTPTRFAPRSGTAIDATVSEEDVTLVKSPDVPPLFVNAT